MRPGFLNAVQLLGNSLLVICVWIVNMIVGILLYGEAMFQPKHMLMSVNLLIGGFVALALGFLVSSVVRGRNAQSAIANTLSLGLSFISGVFVPLEILGDGVKTIASFTPVYWFVKVNEAIAKLSELHVNQMGNVFRWTGIQILFGVAFLTIALVVFRQRSMGDRI